MATAYLNVVDFGAKGDGKTDNETALQNAFNAAKAQGLPVYIPPGTFLHSGTLTANGITVFGAGESTVLKAINPANAAFFLTGTNPALYDVKLDGSGTSRGLTNETSGVVIDHATGFKVENVHVLNAMGAGIMNWGGSNGYIAHNYVEHSFADAIHNTVGANNTVIEYNRVYQAGDDGVAVVSYGTGTAGMVSNITVQNNTILDSLWGRALSVVGGTNIQILNNHVDGSAGAAGIYISSEAEYGTNSVHGVTVKGNTLIDAGGTTTGHGAITLYNSEPGQTIDSVTISDNQVISPARSAILVTGTGAISANVSNTSVYADTSHAIYEAYDPSANITQSNNVRAGTTAPTAELSPAGGGVDMSLSLPMPIGSGSGGTTTPTTPSVPTTPSTPSSSGASGSPSDAGSLTLHVSGDQYAGNPSITVFVDGKQVGGTYDVSASHSAGQWQDIVIPGVTSASDVDVTFSNDAYAGPGMDRNIYIGWIDVNGQKVQGTAAASNTGSQGLTATDSAIMVQNGTASFHLSAATTTDASSTPTTPSTPTTVSDTPTSVPPPTTTTSSGTSSTPTDTSHGLTLHVSGDQYAGNPSLTVFVDGKQVGGTYDVTASHGAGQWQDIVIPGVTSASEVDVKFGNDAYGGSPSMDRNVYIGWIDVNGQKVEGTAAASNTGSQGLTATDSAIMVQNGTASFKLPQLDTSTSPPTLVGTAQDDILNATKNLVMTGAGKHDTFVFDSLNDTGVKITDFHTSGANQSKLDLSGVFASINYHGTDPIADKVLSFTADGHGGTAVMIDPDGTGAAHAVTLATLDHVTPSHIVASDFFWA